MADRRRQVIQLLGSLYDGLYLPAGALSSSSGFVPATLEVCSVCDGARWVRDRYGRLVKCVRCQGRGRLAFDPMDAQHVPVGSTSTTSSARPRRTVPCDRCDGGMFRGGRCPSCGGEGRRDLHAFELHLDTRDVEERDPLCDAIEKRAESGSYPELGRALDALGRAHPEQRRLVERRYRHALPLELDGEPAAEAGLVFLAERMPDPIKVPADVRANAKLQAEQRRRVRGRGTDERALVERNREIAKLVRQGRPTQWVAREYGLSVSQVNRLARGDAA